MMPLRGAYHSSCDMRVETKSPYTQRETFALKLRNTEGDMPHPPDLPNSSLISFLLQGACRAEARHYSREWKESLLASPLP